MKKDFFNPKEWEFEFQLMNPQEFIKLTDAIPRQQARVVEYLGNQSNS